MRKTLAILFVTAVAAVALLAIPTIGSSATQTVRVNEVSYRISLSVRPKAGMVRFVVRNRGDDPHDFWLRGGGKRYHTRVVGEGGTATLTVRLKRGVRYSYWCGVSHHAQEGMRGSFVAR
jgi:hypothetical protein